ncbi:MAG: hypothetical protein MJ069_10545 [Salinivirgaceae bacterium]|nr:hypothetical protein [Salinivirgaceae bacterium]
MKKALVIFLILEVVFFVHFGLAWFAPHIVKNTLGQVTMMYSLVGVLTVVQLILSVLIARKWPQKAAVGLLGLNTLKLLVSLVLFLVMVVPICGKSVATGLNFCVVYFYFLIFGAVFMTQILFKQPAPVDSKANQSTTKE